MVRIIIAISPVWSGSRRGYPTVRGGPSFPSSGGLRTSAATWKMRPTITALQTKVEKRFSHGYQFLAHYTWAKAINFDGDYYNTDPKVNRGPNDFNRAHVFVLVNLWELPVGKGKRFAGNISRMADYLIGGLQVNAVTKLCSGVTFLPSFN